LETALANLAVDHPDRALVLALLCSELSFGSPLERRRDLADEAITIARSTGDDATLVRVLNHVFLPLVVPPLLGQTLTRSAEALARAERVGDPVLLFWAASLRGWAAARAGDIDELDRCLELGGSLASQLNQPTLTWQHRIWCATRALIAGDADRGEQLATEALQIGTDAGEPDATALFGGQLMSASRLRGTIGELVPLIEQGAADRPLLPGYVAALAWAHAETGQTEPAHRLLEKFAATGFAFPADTMWLTAMALYAIAAVECREPVYAGPLLERLAPWADQWDYAGINSQGPISHHLGGLATVLGRYDEAEAYFARASASTERAGAKFFAAQTQLWWGRMLVERQAPGDAQRAREFLIEARATASVHGYAAVERRAAEALCGVGLIE
jgi:tetratricopeptide (TPR) repeat protein